MTTPGSITSTVWTTSTITRPIPAVVVPTTTLTTAVVVTTTTITPSPSPPPSPSYLPLPPQRVVYSPYTIFGIILAAYFGLGLVCLAFGPYGNIISTNHKTAPGQMIFWKLVFVCAWPVVLAMDGLPAIVHTIKKILYGGTTTRENLNTRNGNCRQPRTPPPTYQEAVAQTLTQTQIPTGP